MRDEILSDPQNVDTADVSRRGFVKLGTLRLRYTVLGISTGQTIPLQSPLTLRCR